MRGKSIVFYASVALNVALLVLVAWPRSTSQVALGESVFASVGPLVATVSKGGGNQDVVWMADRPSGIMLLYQYQLGENRPALVDRIDLKVGLEERQIGQLMLLPSAYSDNYSVVYVIDTDSGRVVVYEYERSNKAVRLVDKIDLRAAFTGAVAPVVN